MGKPFLIYLFGGFLLTISFAEVAPDLWAISEETSHEIVKRDAADVEDDDDGIGVGSIDSPESYETFFAIHPARFVGPRQQEPKSGKKKTPGLQDSKSSGGSGTSSGGSSTGGSSSGGSSGTQTQGPGVSGGGGAQGTSGSSGGTQQGVSSGSTQTPGGTDKGTSQTNGTKGSGTTSQPGTQQGTTTESSASSQSNASGGSGISTQSPGASATGTQTPTGSGATSKPTPVPGSSNANTSKTTSGNGTSSQTPGASDTTTQSPAGSGGTSKPTPAPLAPASSDTTTSKTALGSSNSSQTTEASSTKSPSGSGGTSQTTPVPSAPTGSSNTTTSKPTSGPPSAPQPTGSGSGSGDSDTKLMTPEKSDQATQKPGEATDDSQSVETYFGIHPPRYVGKRFKNGSVYDPPFAQGRSLGGDHSPSIPTATESTKPTTPKPVQPTATPLNKPATTKPYNKDDYYDTDDRNSPSIGGRTLKGNSIDEEPEPEKGSKATVIVDKDGKRKLLSQHESDKIQEQFENEINNSIMKALEN